MDKISVDFHGLLSSLKRWFHKLPHELLNNFRLGNDSNSPVGQTKAKIWQVDKKIVKDIL